jgi:outer membrane protein assembly factor BamB
VGDRLFVLANDGLQNEFVLALTVRDGQQVWSTRLGAVGNPKQVPDFPGARSTPTVDGDWVYAFSSDGDLACLEKQSGKKRWQKNVRAEFGGKPGLWAYSESPLVDNELLVCSPGGNQATVVGLNKATGDVVWKSALPEGDDAAYASAKNDMEKAWAYPVVANGRLYIRVHGCLWCYNVTRHVP